MPFRRILLTTLVGLVLGAPAVAEAQSALYASRDYDGAAAMGLALRRLGTTARVLHIGAHPDDENTALFSPLALGQGVDAAYLSLTRGEGGQNGIGPELGVALGVVRSEELVAARSLDGGDQYFARVIDYGYSKSAEEAFQHWPRDTLVGDVVEIIRRYRPDVVVSAWSGSDWDGHGQHQASGIVSAEAVVAAADPGLFPEQLAAGLRPHTTALYYRSSRYAEGTPDVELDTGVLDPLLGASYYQLAMASRSRHRSQDQGRSLSPGPRRTSFDQVEPQQSHLVSSGGGFGRYGQGSARETRSLFAGVDTLLSQRTQRIGTRVTGATGRTLATATDLLREYEDLVARARGDFNPMNPGAIVPILGQAQTRLNRVATLTEGLEDEGADTGDLSFHLDGELRDLRTALLLAASIRLDIRADRSRVTPGSELRLELSLWNGGVDVARAEASPLLPAGWDARLVEGDRRLEAGPGERVEAVYVVLVPDDVNLTMPYYLDPTAPAPEDVYRWPQDMEVRGLPFAPPPVRGAFRVSLQGADGPLAADLDAMYVGVDRRSGEFREPVKVVPAVTVAAAPELAVIRTASVDPFAVSVRVRSQRDGPSAGEVVLDLPGGWRASPRTAPVALESTGSEQTVSFQVEPPADVIPGAYEIGAYLDAGSARYDLSFAVVDYPHIQPHHLYRAARVRVRVMDVEVADVRVGYIPGSGDGIPEALSQLGLEWETLDPAALAASEFDRFDVVVTGARAYEVNDALVAANPRLLEWVRDGGNLVVNYNKYPALDRDYTPWPVTIDRPHGRVTDEGAPVRILEPDHPVLNTPNLMGPADWEGWVQERGLYFWETWPESLAPLLAMSDPGEEDLLGSLLVGPLGEGTYAYTALAFFRQLPEGVPGAYRLFANLLSLGAE